MGSRLHRGQEAQCQLVRGGLHAQPARAMRRQYLAGLGSCRHRSQDLLSPVAQAQLATTEPLEDGAFRASRQSCCLDMSDLVKTWTLNEVFGSDSLSPVP